MVGDRPESHVYVRHKIRMAEKLGMLCRLEHFPEDTAQSSLLDMIAEKNSDDSVHGILVQLPLPKHMDKLKVLNTIVPHKDVDGLNAVNVGKACCGLSGAIWPCTARAVRHLAHMVHGDDLSGKLAVVVGASQLVGRPSAEALLQSGATVLQAHSKTEDLPVLCRQADILISATGAVGLIRGHWIKPGATVIDVGITRGEDNKLYGDVAFDEALGIAGAITPVPGGVGPLTVAFLMTNLVDAYQAAAA